MHTSKLYYTFAPESYKLNIKYQSKMEENINKKGFIKETIEHLDVGESYDFPIEKLMTVAAMASNYGAITRRTYSTARDRELGIVKVTRTS